MAETTETAKTPESPLPPAALRRRRNNKPPKPTELQAIFDSLMTRINPAMRDAARKKIETVRTFLDGSVERARDDFKALADSLVVERDNARRAAESAGDAVQLQDALDRATKAESQLSLATADRDAAQNDLKTAAARLDGMAATVADQGVELGNRATIIAGLETSLADAKKRADDANALIAGATNERDRLSTSRVDAVALLDGLDVSALPGDVRGQLATLRGILTT